MKVSLDNPLRVVNPAENPVINRAEAYGARTPSAPEARPLSPHENEENPSNPKAIPGPEELEKILEEIRRKFEFFNQYLKMEVDEELGVTVVKIIDKKSQKVLRQVPPEYLLEIMKKFDEMLGLLIDERV